MEPTGTSGAAGAPPFSERWVTQKAYAAYIGVTPQAVNKLAKKGRVVIDDATKKVDWRASDDLRRRTADPARGTNGVAAVNAAGADGDEGSYTAAKLREANARASLREIELAQRRGELVETIEAQTAMQEVVGALAARLEQMVPVLADRVSTVTDVDTARKIVDEEVNKARTAMAEALEQEADRLGRTRH